MDMWVEFAICSLPCSKRFCSRYSGFPLSLRDLSEISKGGGGVETEGGSQLFETQKREGS